MYSLHTKKESAHNDSIWCCDWRQIKQVSETPEGIPGEDMWSGKLKANVCWTLGEAVEAPVTQTEEIIVTGGVDDVVKIWNYRDGELEYRHQLTDHSLGVVRWGTVWRSCSL